MSSEPGPAGLLSRAFIPAEGREAGCRLEVERVLRQLHEQHDPLVAAQAALGLAYLDRLGESGDVLGRLVDARSGRAIGSALPVIASWCLANWPAGRWSRIGELSAEYDRLTARHDAADFLSPLPSLAAGLLAAARGDHDSARTAAARLSGPADSPGDVGRLLAHHVSGLLALGDGDFGLAYEQLAHLGAGESVAHRSWATLDLVEAAWRSGHPDQARAWVDALSRLPATRLSERLGWIVQAGRAVTAGPDTAGLLFAAAVGAPAAQRWPFDLARMQLAHGEHLVARRDGPAARLHLHQAARTFGRLGVPLWHGRAQQFLRAADRGSPASHPSPSESHRPPSRTLVSSAREDTPILRKAR